MTQITMTFDLDEDYSAIVRVLQMQHPGKTQEDILMTILDMGFQRFIP